mgnify:CR=1 FL=1
MTCEYNLTGHHCRTQFSCAACPTNAVKKPHLQKPVAQPDHRNDDGNENNTFLKHVMVCGLGLSIVFLAASLFKDYDRGSKKIPPASPEPTTQENRQTNDNKKSGAIIEKIEDGIREFMRPDPASSVRTLPAPMLNKSLPLRHALEAREFFDGIKTGENIIYHGSNQLSVEYRGEVENGMMNGNGELWYRDLSRNTPDTIKYFHGYFKDGYIDGIGRMTYFTGEWDYAEGYFQGTWNNMSIVGDVFIRFKNGSSFYGTMEAGNIIKGECESASGEKTKPLYEGDNNRPTCQ